MKKLQHVLILTLLCIIYNNSLGQAPQAISYQAIARDNGGSIIANQTISLRFRIHQFVSNGIVVYSETQSTTTNVYGLFSLSIGQGTVVSGQFSAINWSSGLKFLQVELDATGGSNYSDMGTTQMLSVPYALNAHIADSSLSPPRLDSLVLRDSTGDVRIVLNPNNGSLKMMNNDTVWYSVSVNSAPYHRSDLGNGSIFERYTGSNGDILERYSKNGVVEMETSFNRDANGNMTETHTVYNADGTVGQRRVVSGNIKRVTFYENEILVSELLDSAGQKYSKTYHPNGTVSSFTEEFIDAGEQVRRTTNYDSTGHVQSVCKTTGLYGGKSEWYYPDSNKTTTVKPGGVTVSDPDNNTETVVGPGFLEVLDGNEPIKIEPGKMTIQTPLGNSEFDGSGVTVETGEWMFRNGINPSGDFYGLRADTITDDTVGYRGNTAGLTFIAPTITFQSEQFELSNIYAPNPFQIFTNQDGDTTEKKNLEIYTYDSPPSKPVLTLSSADGAKTVILCAKDINGEQHSGSLKVEPSSSKFEITATDSGTGNSCTVTLDPNNSTVYVPSVLEVDDTVRAGGGLKSNIIYPYSSSTVNFPSSGIFVTGTGNFAGGLLSNNIGPSSGGSITIGSNSTVNGDLTATTLKSNTISSGSGGTITITNSSNLIGDFTATTLKSNTISPGSGGTITLTSNSLVNGDLTATTLKSNTISSGSGGTITITNSSNLTGDFTATTLKSNTISPGSGGTITLTSNSLVNGDLTATTLKSNTISSGSGGTITITNSSNLTGDFTATTLKSNTISPGSGGTITLTSNSLVNGDLTATTLKSNTISSGSGGTITITNSSNLTGDFTATTLKSNTISPGSGGLITLTNNSLFQGTLTVNGNSNFGSTIDVAGAAQIQTNGNFTGAGVNVQNVVGQNQVQTNNIFPLPPSQTVTVHGNLNVVGNLTKGGGNFKIDHPLDPYNKYLIHSFVEAPERTNIYSGNIVTDNNGIASVEMPEYFEKANTDFRYQLTVIGTDARAYILKEVEKNKFEIKTDKGNVKVSWQITTTRQDNFAKNNQYQVEMEKEPEMKGKLLYE